MNEWELSVVGNLRNGFQRHKSTDWLRGRPQRDSFGARGRGPLYCNPRRYSGTLTISSDQFSDHFIFPWKQSTMLQTEISQMNFLANYYQITLLNLCDNLFHEVSHTGMHFNIPFPIRISTHAVIFTNVYMSTVVTAWVQSLDAQCGHEVNYCCLSYVELF